MGFKEKIKEFTGDKALGFWFTAAICVLSLITSIVYAAVYAGTDNIDWVSFAFMLTAFAGALVMTVLKKYKWTPYLQAALTFMALLFYVYGIYYYVSVVMVGIDLDHFEAPFIVTAILYAVTFGLSIANLFLKQVKDKQENNEVKEGNDNEQENAEITV